MARPPGCSGVSSTDGDGGSSAEAAGVSCSTAPRSKSSRDGISASPPGSGRPASACSAWGGSPSAPARGSVRLRSSRLGSSMPARTSSDGASMDMASSDGGLSGGASVGMVSSRGASVETVSAGRASPSCVGSGNSPISPSGSPTSAGSSPTSPDGSPTGNSPRSLGSSPRSLGSSPRSLGSSPRSPASPPRSLGSSPRSPASPPTSSGKASICDRSDCRGADSLSGRENSSTAGSAGSPAALSAGPPREGSRSSMGGVVDSSPKREPKSSPLSSGAGPGSPSVSGCAEGGPVCAPESRSSRLERSRPKS